MNDRTGLGRGGGSGFFNLLGGDPKIHSDSAKGIKQAHGQSGFMAGGPPKSNQGTSTKAEAFALDLIDNGDDMDDVVREIMSEFNMSQEEAEQVYSDADNTRIRMEGPDNYDDEEEEVMTVNEDDGGFTGVDEFVEQTERHAPTDADDSFTEIEEITKDLPEQEQKPSAFTKIRRAGKVAFGSISKLAHDYKEDKDSFKQQLHDLSDSQLKEAAVRFQGSGSGLLGGTNNPFTGEAVRRIKEGKQFDDSIKKAQTGENESGSDGFSLKELF